jgi:rhodanese-related sulfurtransferase
MPIVQRVFPAAAWMCAALCAALWSAGVALAQQAPPMPPFPDSVRAWVAATKQQVKTVNLPQFRTLVDQGQAGLIVDVRQESEFESGRVPGAINLPRGVIEFTIWERLGYPRPVDMNAQMTLYCRTGGRCALATKSLQELGFTNVTAVDMTWDNWVQGGHPVEKSTPPGR